MPQMAAAGGIVLCGGYALLIRKHGQWDIPKGKTKKKEPSEICAVREIAEETGLDKSLLSVRRPLCRSSYISYYSGKPFNKTVDWFLLDYAGSLADPLTPDISENIDLCAWIAAADLLPTMQTAREYLDAVKPALAAALAMDGEPTAAGSEPTAAALDD